MVTHVFDSLCEPSDCPHREYHSAVGQTFKGTTVYAPGESGVGGKRVHTNAWCGSTIGSGLGSACRAFKILLENEKAAHQRRCHGIDPIWTYVGSDGTMHGSELCYANGRHCLRWGQEHPALKTENFKAHIVADTMRGTETARARSLISRSRRWRTTSAEPSGARWSTSRPRGINWSCMPSRATSTPPR